MADEIGGGMTQESPEQATNMTNADPDTEFQAMAQIYAALKPLDVGGRKRVLDYVLSRLGVDLRPKLDEKARKNEALQNQETELDDHALDEEATKAKNDIGLEDNEVGEIEGISPVAKKWMKRTALPGEKLSELFSLGVDEIDLVSNSVPGQNTKERLRSLILLQGIASYLGTGAPRVDYSKLKLAMQYYGIDPGKNMSTYLKDFASESSGSVSAGFTLTARGLNSATELIKEMVGRK
jgi:hypothetical protein